MTWTPERHAAARKRCEGVFVPGGMILAAKAVEIRVPARQGAVVEIAGNVCSTCDVMVSTNPPGIHVLERRGTADPDLPDALDEIERLQAIVALRQTAQITHSEECWRWHHVCAVRRIEELESKKP